MTDGIKEIGLLVT